MTETADRLFVPLAAGPFSWFESGVKKWELRRLGRQFTPKNLMLGRAVELRRGYADARTALWGRIGEVVIAPDLETFFDCVSWRMVLPEAGDRAAALREAEAILNLGSGEGGPFIGFRVDRPSNGAGS